MVQTAAKIVAATVTIPSQQVGIPNIAADQNAWQKLVALAFIAIGAMAVLFLVIGGIMYITSNGDQSQIQRAKNTILYAVVGIIVSLLAFTIVQFVLGWF